jgi:hypothetical protein
MFVRKKTTWAGAVKHYLVESRREGGKVRQRVLYYLGDCPTVEEQLARYDYTAGSWREAADYQRQRKDDYDAAIAAGADDLMRDLLGSQRAHVERLLADYERRAAWYAAEAAKLRGILSSAHK